MTEAEEKIDTEDESPDEEIEVPSILDSFSEEYSRNFKPPYERYFTKKYCTSFTTPDLNLDTCIRVHTNKVCLVYLSEKHSILQNQQRISSLNFKVSKNTDRLRNRIIGRNKKGAQLLQPDSVLVYVETTDGCTYPVHAGIYGKLLEINHRLPKDPNLLVDNLNEGFLAIILPYLNRHEENLSFLKTAEEYLKTEESIKVESETVKEEGNKSA